MQPCHICGAVDIDAGGFCLNCRTYRGAVYEVPPQTVEQYAYGATGSPAAVSGVPVATSGAPYPGPVAYPTAPSQQPTSGVPDAVASATRRVPMISFVLVAGALVVVLAALVVVLINSGGNGRKARNAADANASTSASGKAPAASASPSIKPGLDTCVVGTWLVTNDFRPLDADGKTGLSTKSGATWRFGPDGKGAVDYGSGVSYSGKVDGKKVEDMLFGTAAFDYATVNRSINFSNYNPDVRAISVVDDVVQSNTKLPFNNETAPFSCSGDVLTFFPDTKRAATFQRQ